MSTTNIYRLGREPSEIGEVRNSWRSAMYVWNDIAKRYFGLDGFPIVGEAEKDRIWNAHRHAKLAPHEAIVLLSTMDFAVVRGRDRTAVADAFDKYAGEHPSSSFAEQANILRAADIRPDDWIGWQQTSVSNFWGATWEEDDATWYDPSADDKHFDAYAEAVAA